MPDSRKPSGGTEIESEVVARVVSTSGRVAEVPIEYGRRELGVAHDFLILKEMVRPAWRYNPALLLSAALPLPIPGLPLGGLPLLIHRGKVLR